ncbi:DUF7373 family lipoprotein [Nocardia bovistercoris]|uniref:Uncharacterized protein n=1 Tax=Nocardia bovistercoris TaxID=2785916 RepID=A0A931N3T8_9NOCA|nr:hypothetical protein [Nocardia bovistercoris]MBH0777546.1 hypothetical protein [Nocardia bovistercoris]
MRFRHLFALCVATATVFAAGCSDPEASTPAVDISALDSGNYPTAPRDLAALRDPKYGPLREAVRIGATVPTFPEMDPRFTFQRLSGPERRVIPGSPPALWSLESAEFAELTTGLVTGWTTSAERRASTFLGRQLTATVLRFTDAAAADTAGARLIERQARNAPGDTVAIPDHPSARAKFTPAKHYLDVWEARDSLLLWVHVDDPISEPVQAAPLAELARHTIDAMVDGLKSYTPTPADQLTSIPVDVDGMLGRTLPPANVENAKFDRRSFVMPARAALHYVGRPANSKSAYDDAGVDLVAFSDARLYRAKDPDAAERLVAAFLAQLAEGTKAIDPPSGLPTARCLAAKDDKRSGTYPPSCLVVYERFVAVVSGGNPQEVHQKAAAQYKLLAAE